MVFVLFLVVIISLSLRQYIDTKIRRQESTSFCIDVLTLSSMLASPLPPSYITFASFFIPAFADDLSLKSEGQ